MTRHGSGASAGTALDHRKNVHALGGLNTFQNSHPSRSRQAPIQLVPVWSDDRYFIGWLSTTEATALARAPVGALP
jgi:hypothetical protein